MKSTKLGLKVSLIVTVMIALIVGFTILIIYFQTDNMVQKLASKEAGAANTAFVRTIQELKADALARAEMIAKSPDVIAAVNDGSGYMLKQSLYRFRAGLEVITLCDENGIVLVRTHSDEKGDSALSQKSIRAAIETGTGISTIEKGSFSKLATRGSSTIRGSDGTIIGAVNCGHELSLEKYVDEMKIRNNCEATIFDYDTRLSTTLLDDNGERIVGTKAPDVVIQAVLVEGRSYEAIVPINGKRYYAFYSPIIEDGEVIGMLYTGLAVDETIRDRNAMIAFMVIVIIAIGGACVAVIFVFGMVAIGRPLRKIGHFAERIQTGDLGISSSSEITIDVHSHDEIGTMARVLEKAFAGLRGYIDEIMARMQGLANGDLVTESTYEFHGDFILIKDSINNIIETLNQTMMEVNDSAAQVSTSSMQVALGSQALAQGAIEQAASIDRLSGIVSDIMAETEHNANVAKEATEVSGAIRGKAEKGSALMDNMMRAIHEITEASSKISKVNKVIDDIAFQTNILALNAAVEAARAGQHGRGFAVVADEVRDLANKSAVAARDAEKLVEDSVEKANLGLGIATETADSLKEIVEGINRSAEIVAQIAKSSEEQAASIAQVNNGIEQVAQVVRQNSNTAESSASASEQMSGMAEMLKRLMSYFKIAR